MKLNVPTNLTSEDVPAITLGLYHTAKSLSVSERTPENAVEQTLSTSAATLFEQYLTRMGNDVVALMENSR
jgi:hypothetical protein